MNVPRSFAFFANLGLAATLVLGGCKSNSNANTPAASQPAAQPAAPADASQPAASCRIAAIGCWAGRFVDAGTGHATGSPSGRPGKQSACSCSSATTGCD